MNDVGGLVLVEHGLGVPHAEEIGVLGPQEDPLLILALVLGDDLLDGLAHEAGAAGDENDLEILDALISSHALLHKQKHACITLSFFKIATIASFQVLTFHWYASLRFGSTVVYL